MLFLKSQSFLVVWFFLELGHTNQFSPHPCHCLLEMQLETGIWIWSSACPLSWYIPVQLVWMNGFIGLYSFSSQREMCLLQWLRRGSWSFYYVQQMCPGKQERIAKKHLGFSYENSSDLAPTLALCYTLTRFFRAEAKSLKYLHGICVDVFRIYWIPKLFSCVGKSVFILKSVFPDLVVI